MKRVLLVNTNTEKAPYPVPPLGLCMLASSLRDHYEVKIYDGVFDEGQKLVAMVEQFNPDYIGFSIRNIDDVVMDRAIFYLNEILDRFIQPVMAITEVPIILGGSGFSIFPVECMKLSGADYGIVGEGEVIFPALLDRLQFNLDLSVLPNLITSVNWKIQPGSAALYSNPMLKRFPEIDTWIDFTPYLTKGVYSIQTKRGCSHGCIYCTYPLIEGRTFRTRKPSDIADEIEQAHKRLGYITFEFVDSTFNDPMGHAESICREIIKRNLKVKLRTMGINPRHTSEELFELMAEAGFVQIDATPDSASPLLLKNLAKGFNLQEVEKMTLLIRKFNIPTMWFFLFGGPGEDEDTFHQTLDFVDKYVNPEDMVYMNSGLRIYPNTPLYSMAVEEGRLRAGEPVFQPPAYYFSDKITKNRLEQLMHEASLVFPNCIPALQSSPPPGMITDAMAIRQRLNLNEPMFRTLLKIKKVWREEGKI